MNELVVTSSKLNNFAGLVSSNIEPNVALGTAEPRWCRRYETEVRKFRLKECILGRPRCGGEETYDDFEGHCFGGDDWEQGQEADFIWDMKRIGSHSHSQL
jgi:hypothetical protein